MTHTEPDLAHFRESAAAGILALKVCSACHAHHHPPRDFCPFCASRAVVWAAASGRASITTFTIWRRRGGNLIPALVELAEGPIIMTHIETEDEAGVHIGQPVTIGVRQTDDGVLPIFIPSDR